MSTRDQVIEYLRQVLGGKNTLDLLADGLDDPDFDPEKPYRGNPKKPEPFEDSEQAQMLLDMMVYALETMTWNNQSMHDMAEDAFLVTSVKLAPVRQIFNINVTVP
jgi:hypothetical protein